jgi:hypothetical protein
MPTIQQIVDYVQRKYPESTNETDANIVSDLNDIHNEIFVKISTLSNQFELYNTTTVDGQASYSLPSDCEMENIVNVLVEDDVSSGEYDRYDFATLNQNIDSGHYYMRGTAGVFLLTEDGEELADTGRNIYIYYNKRPTQLSSSDMSATPDLNEDYHNILKWKLIAELASQGSNPDTMIADFWQRKADEFLNNIIKSLDERYNNSPDFGIQLESRWG